MFTFFNFFSLKMEKSVRIWHWDLQNINCFLVTKESQYTSLFPRVFQSRPTSSDSELLLTKSTLHPEWVSSWRPRHLQNHIRLHLFWLWLPTQHFAVENPCLLSLWVKTTAMRNLRIRDPLEKDWGPMESIPSISSPVDHDLVQLRAALGKWPQGLKTQGLKSIANITFQAQLFEDINVGIYTWHNSWSVI